MVTLLDTLKSVNAYPIPLAFIETAAARRGLALDTAVTTEAVATREYRLTRADLLWWLSEAPSISQGGQSYSFDSEQRQKFRNEALATYAELEEEEESASPKTIYGYKGSRL